MDNPLAKRFREFIQTPGHARTVSALVILIIAAAVPLTVLVAQQRQNTQQHASTPTPTPTCYHPCGSSCSSCYGSSLCGSGQHLVCQGCAPTCVVNSTTAPTPTTAPTSQPTSTPVVNPTTAPTSTPSPYTCQLTAGQSCLASSCGTYGSGSGTCPGGYVCCKYSGAPSCVAPSYMICGPDCYNVSGCKCGTTTGAAAATCVGGGAVCLSALGQCPTSTTTPTSTATPTTTPTPTPTPSSSPSTTVATNLSQQTYCGVGTPPGSTSGNQINVSSTYFTWTRPTDNSPVYITYINRTTGVSYGPYQYGSGTANSYYAPRPVGDNTVTNPTNRATYTFSQCTGNQSGTGYSCGFSGGNTIEWWITTTAGAQSQHVTYTAAVCPPVVTAPACGALTANPSSVNVNGTSNLSISCQNATSYTWSATCGNVNNVSNSSTTWTAPSNGPTSCTVTVNATNSTGTTPSSTSINVAVPTCNGSSQGVGVADCSQAVCQATKVNACGVGSGTETCVLNTYNVNSNVCNPVSVPNQSCSASCANGVSCYNNVCQNASPAPTPSVTPSPAPGDTVLALKIGMDAIGSVGDNENPNPSSSNQNPQHPQRNIELWVFDGNNNQVADKLGSINYNANSGIFTGSVDLGQPFATGNYTIKVQSPGHLKRIIPQGGGIINITSGQTIQLPQVNLVAGDINGDNAINLTDYNILLSCVNDPNISNIDNHALCNTNANYSTWSDLDDNGVVNEFDYNLFLREYSVQNGE